VTPTQQSTQQSARRRPPGRYAEHGKNRTAAIAVVAALFLALVSWTVWTAAVRATPAVDAGVRSFKVLSDHAVTGTIEVHKAPGATALCDIRARDSYGAQAGIETVTIGPNKSGSRRNVETYILTTNVRPVTFEVQNCRLADAR
jgi:hypothetical protein